MVPVLLTLASPTAEVNTQFSIRINESSVLQLINGISNDLQILLKYFNGTAIFTPFCTPIFPFVSLLSIDLLYI